MPGFIFLITKSLLLVMIEEAFCLWQFFKSPHQFQLQPLETGFFNIDWSLPPEQDMVFSYYVYLEGGKLMELETLPTSKHIGIAKAD
jgi:hypothetical protein